MHALFKPFNNSTYISQDGASRLLIAWPLHRPCLPPTVFLFTLYVLVQSYIIDKQTQK